MGEIEFGKCEICGKETSLKRTYFRYYTGNKCECCGTSDNTHFILVRHCDECTPKPPATIKVELKADNSGFREELEQLINKFSKENGSNTPDYILANYLLGCLNNFDTCVNARDKFYNFKSK